MINYETLDSIPLSTGLTIKQATDLPEVVHLDDPAHHVMIDFDRHTPITIGENNLITEAMHEMKAHGSYLLLVVNGETQVTGLVSSEDILGEKVIKIINEKRTPYNEIKVKMIMTPQPEIIAINFDSIERGKVGNVIKTLKDLKQHYALIVETKPESQQQTIRGALSSSLIGKQLHMDVINTLYAAESIAELKQRHHHKDKG